MVKIIKVNKMNGDEIVVNTRLIETIRATPDTLITLTNNKKILVNESVEEIIDKVIAYERKILTPSVEKE